MKYIRLFVLVPVALFAAAAQAATIIDGSTLGFYNAGLGDLALDSVLGAQTDTGTGFRVFPAANVAQGDPLIPPVASEPDLSGADAATQAALGSFLGNTTALGGTWSAAPQAIPSTWAINTETAIVYVINAGPGLTNVAVSLGVDNGAFVWLNGVYIFGALAPGGAPVGEYGFALGSLSGTNYLQILREDHGGATGWNIEVTGDRVPEELVPEPHSFAMFAGGLLMLGVLARRRRRL